MSEKTDVNSIGFLETMLQYYLPGLDTSAMSDEQFTTKVAHLQTIRFMEQHNKINEVLKNFISE